ncbi:hypothetical protein L208DRAFT_1404319 [Tricholoma matsutake]|nr:hypothetical protein L208DRAFT_1404319 [Tricholoma matsutake 945]
MQNAGEGGLGDVVWGGCHRPPLLACVCRRSKPHPSSTLRAEACRRGDGCRDCHNPGVPTIHPTSRCSLGCW